MPKSKAERRRKTSVHRKTQPKVHFVLRENGLITGPGDDARRRFPLRQQVKRRGGIV